MLIDKVREGCPVGGKSNSKNVVKKATIFPMEKRKDIKYTLEFLLEIGSICFIVIGIPFLAPP